MPGENAVRLLADGRQLRLVRLANEVAHLRQELAAAQGRLRQLEHDESVLLLAGAAGQDERVRRLHADCDRISGRLHELRQEFDALTSMGMYRPRVMSHGK